MELTLRSELLKKVDEVENSYPRHIQYSNIHEWSRNQGYSGHETYIVTRIHLDVLQCRFLFEKLKLSRGFVSGQRVLHIAQEMMTAVLNVWLNREELQLYHFAFDWIVSYSKLSYSLLRSRLISIDRLSAMESQALARYARSFLNQRRLLCLGLRLSNFLALKSSRLSPCLMGF